MELFYLIKQIIPSKGTNNKKKVILKRGYKIFSLILIIASSHVKNTLFYYHYDIENCVCTSNGVIIGEKA